MANQAAAPKEEIKEEEDVADTAAPCDQKVKEEDVGNPAPPWRKKKDRAAVSDDPSEARHHLLGEPAIKRKEPAVGGGIQAGDNKGRRTRRATSSDAGAGQRELFWRSWPHAGVKVDTGQLQR